MVTDEEPLTISEAALLIRSGELTPSELLEQCLSRIDRYEPSVKAWVYLDRERSRRDAERLTEELKNGTNRGPLHGIPIGIKDIIDVYDMPTGCGSKAWANSYARQDATCVERLRQAGAIIPGKTVTTAYAYIDPPITRNPWNLERTPGGSSSGSAAAVACGMCLAALGTQTGGSITRPASYCGIYSLKPTYSRVSVRGVLPLASSLDHVGVLGNCVRDLAVVFQVIAGYDPGYAASSQRSVPECVLRIDEFLTRKTVSQKNSLSRPGFQIPTTFFYNHISSTIANFFTSFHRDLLSLASSDAVIKEISLPPIFANIHRLHRSIMAVEAAENHGSRLQRHPDDYPLRIRDLVQEGQTISASDYREARVLRDDLDNQFCNLPTIEPLVMPATLDAAPPPDTTGNPWCNSPWSFLGVPTVSIPLGWSDGGLPLAVQFIGAEWREDSLLVQAAAVESAFRNDNAFQPRGLPPVL